jgi:putative endonuclease
VVDRRRQELGAAGEALAARWYEAEGFEILARNWRCREGELDLVARRGPLVVFCEVKTRRTAAFGVPAEAVTVAKQRRIRVLATRWLRESGMRAQSLRFDVASVLAGELEMIEAAF